MVDIISAARAYHQYQEALARLSRVKIRLEGLEDALRLNGPDPQLQARLEQAQAEAQAAREEVDKLYYPANFGISREQAKAARELRDSIGFRGF